MFDIRESDSKVCDGDNCKDEELVRIAYYWGELHLCEKCMQDLNRTLVEYLADKNI